MLHNVGHLLTDLERARVTGARLELGGGVVLFVRQLGGANRRATNLAAILRRQLGDESIELAAADTGQTLERLEAAQELELTVAAETLVAAWEGVESAPGVAAECTPANVRWLLERAPEVLRSVIELASDPEVYRLERDCKSDPGSDAMGARLRAAAGGPGRARAARDPADRGRAVPIDHAGRGDHASRVSGSAG